MAAIVYLGAAGAGQAGQYVDWLDDGTVLLKLGPEYDNAVLETSRAELGSRFGPDARSPSMASRSPILTQDEGPKGAISGPIEALRPVWEELTGGKLEIALVPVTDLYATMMLDLQQGTGRYDAMVVAAFFYGDLVAGKYIVPVEPFMASGKYPQWSYDSMPPSLATLYHWGDVGYGVLNDADGQILYYRRDVLNDPKWQAAFQKATGHAMAVPPKTWQQLLEISQFFAGKNWDNHDRRARRGHRAPSQGRRAGPLPLPVALGLVRDHAGRQGRPLSQRLLVRPDRHEAADQQPRPRRGARVPAAAERDRAGRADRLAPAPGLGVLPARQGGVHVHLGRPRRALPGRDPLERQGQLRRDGAAELRHATGTWRRRPGSRPPSRASSATPRAAPGTA